MRVGNMSNLLWWQNSTNRLSQLDRMSWSMLSTKVQCVGCTTLCGCTSLSLSHGEAQHKEKTHQSCFWIQLCAFGFALSIPPQASWNWSAWSWLLNHQRNGRFPGHQSYLHSTASSPITVVHQPIICRAVFILLGIRSIEWENASACKTGWCFMDICRCCKLAARVGCVPHQDLDWAIPVRQHPDIDGIDWDDA